MPVSVSGGNAFSALGKRVGGSASGGSAFSVQRSANGRERIGGSARGVSALSAEAPSFEGEAETPLT